MPWNLCCPVVLSRTIINTALTLKTSSSVKYINQKKRLLIYFTYEKHTIFRQDQNQFLWRRKGEGESVLFPTFVIPNLTFAALESASQPLLVRGTFCICTKKKDLRNLHSFYAVPSCQRSKLTTLWDSVLFKFNFWTNLIWT